MNSLDERMIVLSVQLIRAGRRNLDDVPAHLRTRVEEELNATDQPRDGE